MSKSVDATPKVSLILGVIHTARRRDNARAATTISFEPWRLPFVMLWVAGIARGKGEGGREETCKAQKKDE